MKKTLLSLLAVAATAGTASAQVEIGLKISPSITNLRVDSPTQYAFQNESSKASLGGGVIVDYFFGQNYAFSTGLLLAGKGGTINYYDENTKVREKLKYGIQYLEIPVTIKLFTNDVATDTKLYFQVGGAVDAAIAGKLNGNKFYTDPGTGAETKAAKHVIVPDAALIAGFGAEYQLGQSTKLMAGISYHRGLFNIDRYFDNTRKFKSVTLKNNEFALDLGLKF
ncbi:porin family protein [Hymenobacter jejuensis]|uniref:PorT family protein n=1 Tax=Hymenobacter jejuensis TaxID=2502781 RepID=A0A5B7ZXJ0_9BACT|nr:porin family protein [Hymenobacter jejuensis]QDA59698.1 PorT family protein [Hymenobacter jejuensis]